MEKIKFAFKWNIYGQYPDTAYKDLERLAVAAEDLGFDGVFVVDHIFLPADSLGSSSDADPNKPYFLEAWTVLAAIAAVTKKVKLGPQVTPISLRHPVFIAKMATTIDLISNGRLILQVGTGWHKEEYEKFGFPWDEKFSIRYEKMVEGVEVIKRLWMTDGPANYEGKHYRLENAPFWPKPVQRPRPPIWFGGMGKKVRAAVAKYGDAWSPAMQHVGGVEPKTYAAYWAEIQAAAEAEGRKKDEILAAALFTASIDKDRSKALERASILLRRPTWAHLTMEDLQREGTVIAGNPDDCIKGLQRYVDVGVRYFSFSFLPKTDLDGTVRQLELYSQKVFPHFKG